jgi:hypothetical protein
MLRGGSGLHLRGRGEGYVLPYPPDILTLETDDTYRQEKNTSRNFKMRGKNTRSGGIWMTRGVRWGKRPRRAR